MNLSVSSANAMRRCPRYYFYAKVLRLEDGFKRRWLSFGTAVDRALGVLDYDGLEVAVKALSEHLDDPYDLVDAEAVLRLWDREIKGSKRYLPYEKLPADKPACQYPVEVGFQGNSITGLVNVTVTGFIDKVTLINDSVGPFEGKTTAEPIETGSKFWSRWMLDPQIRCYVWALSQELGFPVNWCVVQAIRRPSTKLGVAFDRKDKEGNPRPLEEYRQRVMNWMADPAKTVVAQKKLYIPEEEKNLWITEHTQIHQMVTERKGAQSDLESQGIASELAWPRNHYGCDLYGGCPYLDLCTGKKSSNDPAFRRKEPIT